MQNKYNNFKLSEKNVPKMNSQVLVIPLKFHDHSADVQLFNNSA